MADILVPLNGHVRVRAWEKQPDGTEKEVYDKTERFRISFGTRF